MCQEIASKTGKKVAQKGGPNLSLHMGFQKMAKNWNHFFGPFFKNGKKMGKRHFWHFWPFLEKTNILS